jgi:hypothetical protein
MELPEVADQSLVALLLLKAISIEDYDLVSLFSQSAEPLTLHLLKPRADPDKGTFKFARVTTSGNVTFIFTPQS